MRAGRGTNSPFQTPRSDKSFFVTSFACVRLKNLPIIANPSALATIVLDNPYLKPRAEDID